MVMMQKKNWLYAVAAAALLASCSTGQKVVVAPVPEYEFRQLDTMVVTAPKKSPAENDSEKILNELPVYQSSHKRENDLLHTRLDLRFDWEKEQVLGKATLRLKPFFYPAETVVLDAKGFLPFFSECLPIPYLMVFYSKIL